MSPEEFNFYVADVQRAGIVSRRMLGGYKVTAGKGKWYLRDALQRHPDVRAEMSTRIDKWEAGAMTKAERREALVEVVVLAWKADREAEAEAAASLRESGIDLTAPEWRGPFLESGIDPADNRVWRPDEDRR